MWRRQRVQRNHHGIHGTPRRPHAGAAALLACALAACPLAARSVQQEARPPQRVEVPLRSQAQLDAYLRRHASARHATPFDALSPGARERFLSSLQWGRSGLGGFDADDLRDELAPDEIRALLQLFGDDIATLAPESRAKPGGNHRAERIDDLERRYNAFHARISMTAPGRNDFDRAAALSADFAALLPEAADPAQVRAAGAHDLGLLWRAALAVSFAEPRPAHVDAALAAFTERSRRGLADAGDARGMRAVLLAGHRFDAAGRFDDAHSDSGLEALPAFDDPYDGAARAATVWRMDHDGSTLSRVALDLDPPQVLVTAGCHFSVDAADAISSDPVLGPAFAAHAHWLVQAPGIEDIGAVREWNRRFPTAQAEMIHARDEWRLLPEWRMPAFHVVRDGKVVETVIGWPDPPTEARQRLVDALRRAGLLERASGAPSTTGGQRPGQSL